jgi:ERCC4 domain-containing protein
VSFLVARNPDPDSRLPYLVRLPIDGGLVLKARDTWPRTSRVFCARADDDWPPDAEILEDVPVTLCRRRGVAIDLVLDRPRENRSQFVFTVLASGREGIFWQTRKVVTTARPGARIPGRRASGIPGLVIVVDTRERYPYGFSKQQATTVRAALAAGDYAVRSGSGTLVAVVERKALSDLAGGLNNGTLVFELAKLAEAPRAAIVVEDRYGNLLKHAYAPTGFLPDMLARVQVRYPEVAIVFLETRPLAEEWTFRYLGAALAEYESEQRDAPREGVAGSPANDLVVSRQPARKRRNTGAQEGP